MGDHVFTSITAGRFGRLRGVILVLCAFLLCASVQVPAAPWKDKPAKGEEERVTVKLRADVQAGFSPLAIMFTGRIKNMDLDDDQFCHPGTLLLRKMITGAFETVAGEDPACLHGPEKQEISPTFSIRHVILDPGAYEFFAMVVTKDGRHITSNGVPVRVVAGAP